MNESKKANENRRHVVFNLLKAMAKIFCPVYVVKGTENVKKRCPSIFVSNHANAKGPIVIELFFPFKFRPWVIYNMTKLKLCVEYVEKDFVIDELKIKRPFSKILAYIIAPFCILVMRSVEAIPVYIEGIVKYSKLLI